MFQSHPQGVILLVRAQPGSRKQDILGIHGERLKIAVHAAPEQGKANAAIIELLAKTCGIKRSQIQLISGEKNQNKSFLLLDQSPDKLRSLLSR